MTDQTARNDQTDMHQILAGAKPTGQVIVSLQADLCRSFAGNGRAACSFDRARQADAELLASIRASGQQTPVVARPVDDAGYRFEIVVGTRRVAAIGAINAELPPGEKLAVRAVLAPMTDEQAYEACIVEHVGRTGWSTMQQARSWSWIIGATYGGDQAKFAAAKNISPSKVSRTLATLRIPAAILGLLRDPEEASPYLAELLVPALNDTDRRDTILAHAAVLGEQGMRLSCGKLAAALLRTPEEQEALAKRYVALGDVERQATIAREANGTCTMRIKSVAANVTSQERKRLFNELKDMIAKHLAL